MQTFPLTTTPNPGQVDAIGFKSVTLIDLSPATSGGILANDPVMLVCQGGYPNRQEIGVIWPWQPLSTPFSYLGTSDASGDLQSPIVTATAVSLNGAGLCIGVGIVPGGGINPWGFSSCSYAPPVPVTPVTPSFTAFVQAVEASWNSHVPVVDFLSPSSWTSASYQTVSPFSPSPVTVAFGTPVALSAVASAAITASLGGTVISQPPTQKDYPYFYSDPGAIPGTLTSVNYIQAEVPIGPSGTNVLGQALAGAIASALFYGRETGIAPAILACFTAVPTV